MILPRNRFAAPLLVLALLVQAPVRASGRPETVEPVSSAPMPAPVAFEPIRGGFCQANDLVLVENMAQAGLNTALVVQRHFAAPPTGEQLHTLGQWAASCRAHDIKFVPVLNYWHEEGRWFEPPARYAARGKVFPKTPCPRDETNFRRLVHERFMALVNFDRGGSIAGAALDTEMYGANFSDYTELCYCDSCWRAFRNAMTNCPDVSLDQREKYLEQAGRASVYEHWWMDDVARQAAATRAAVAAVKADFLIGVLKLDQLRFYREALARGFGTPATPVYAFSEQTYQSGYTERVRQIEAEFARLGLAARFVTGLWQDAIPLEHLAEQYYYAARETAGYWVYTLQDLNPKTSPLSYTERAEYWMAFLQANRELDRAAADPAYKTSLELRPFLTKLPRPLVGITPLPDLAPAYPTKRAAEKTPPLEFRGDNRLAFWGARGDRASFRLVFRRHGKNELDHLEATLIDQRGRPLAHVNILPDEPATLAAELPADGLYGVFLDSQVNVTLVESSTHPYAIDAEKWPRAHLHKPSVPFYFRVRPHARRARLSFFAETVGEVYGYRFETTTGRVLDQGRIGGRQKVEFALDGTEDIVVLHTFDLEEGYFEDVYLAVDEGLSPYFAPTRGGLLEPRR